MPLAVVVSLPADKSSQMPRCMVSIHILHSWRFSLSSPPVFVCCSYICHMSFVRMFWQISLLVASLAFLGPRRLRYLLINFLIAGLASSSIKSFLLYFLSYGVGDAIFRSDWLLCKGLNGKRLKREASGFLVSRAKRCTALAHAYIPNTRSTCAPNKQVWQNPLRHMRRHNSQRDAVLYEFNFNACGYRCTSAARILCALICIQHTQRTQRGASTPQPTERLSQHKTDYKSA